MKKTESNEKAGLLKAQMDAERIECLETVAAKLRERVKELTCLYGISQVVSDPDRSFEQKLMQVLMLLPPAWQFPASTYARIVIDGDTFQSPNFQEGKHKQYAEISAMDKNRGMVEIHSAEEGFSSQKNPFLEEEQSLLNNIAGQVALMIERRESEETKSELQEHLVRAARLSEIGRLAAGVAHELNEPLNTILGFAQLVQKTQGLPDTAKEDLKKITDASLQARSIIRELLIFARQSPHCVTAINLNRIVEDELGLLESMGLKSAVEVRRILDPNVPEIVADKSQILQILSNLVVNAIQAMPDGGILTIRTSFDSSDVSLAVEDTGIGMDEDVKDNLFVPFYTTKDVDQGTGLGLAVVHGIVTSHGGRIAVESESGQGSRFIITLPRKPDTIREASKGNDGTG